ncbi:hypothetical protein Tco_1538320 [Tanacetum coccineum]
MKRWEEIIRENVFGLGGNRDHLSAYLAHVMYCIVAEKQYNLAYFIAKRIEFSRATPKVNLPYDFLLTRLFQQVMEWVAIPLLPPPPSIADLLFINLMMMKRYKRKVNQDKKRWEEIIRENVFGLGGNQDHILAYLAHMISSHQPDDDEEIQEEGTLRNSTKSPRSYDNSLKFFQPQVFQDPTPHEQNMVTLFSCQTSMINRQEEMHAKQPGSLKSTGKAIRGVFRKKK